MNVNVKKSVSDEEAKVLIGQIANEKHYDNLITEECVVSCNGEILFAYIPNAIPNNFLKNAYPYLKTAAGHTNNRGTATFKGSLEYRMKADGTRSKTQKSKVKVMSGIVGYFDRYTRIPYCRTCAWTEKNPKGWKQILPIVHKINSCFEKYVPDVYEKQKKVVDESSEDFTITDTAFSTATINRNWQSAFHRDAKNFEGGMAGMGVVGAGKYDGGYLCFPEYKTAVNVRSSDIIIMNNTHLIHGNTNFDGKIGTYDRISIVCYFRDGIRRCGTRQEELDRAKKHGMFITREMDYV